MNNILINSEIGRLQKVIIHSPGFEVEEMTPKTASQVLYNDILPLPVIAEDHRELKEVLKKIAEVYEVRDLLEDILNNNRIKEEFVNTICRFITGTKNRKNELLKLSPNKLAKISIIGLKQKKDTLTKFLSDQVFDLPPLPNLYFMRDSAIVVGNNVITGSMANRVRAMEAIIAKFIYKYHPEFKTSGFIFDGTIEGKEGKVTIEGGDLLVLKDNIAAIGISERTTSESIDIISDNLVKNLQKTYYIFAVVLPKERAAIHLDMVFTMIDKNRCIIHKPYILGKERFQVVKIKIEPDGTKSYTYQNDLLSGLRSVGLDLEPIICGGNNPLHQQREQWLSGTNFFAFAPGKFIGYDCNPKTLEQISKAGYEVKYAKKILSGEVNIEDYDKLAVGIYGAELARGGGGVRCMTMPAKRKEISW